MKSVINRNYDVTQVVYVSALAAIKWKLIFKNFRVYVTLGEHLKREF